MEPEPSPFVLKFECGACAETASVDYPAPPPPTDPVILAWFNSHNQPWVGVFEWVPTS